MGTAKVHLVCWILGRDSPPRLHLLPCPICLALQVMHPMGGLCRTPRKPKARLQAFRQVWKARKASHLQQEVDLRIHVEERDLHKRRWNSTIQGHRRR